MREIIIISELKIFLLFLALILSTLNFAIADDSEEIKLLVTDFFASLQTGDTDEIIIYLTNPILTDSRELLEMNPGYADQLIRDYGGSEIKLGSISINNNSAFVDIHIKANSGQVRKTKLFCKKIDGSWKISKEISNP